MIHTFTASTTNTDQNRLKICDFVNSHSVKCQQMTLRTIGNTITIEAVINMNFDNLIDIIKEIPAKNVIVSCGGWTRVVSLKYVALGEHISGLRPGDFECENCEVTHELSDGSYAFKLIDK